MCVTDLSGIPNLITADMIKEGAAVIDVGINRVQDPVTGKSRLVGDVDFEGKAGEWKRGKKTPPHWYTDTSWVVNPRDAAGSSACLI